MNPFGMAAYAALFSNTGWFYAMLCTGAGVILSKGDYTSVRYLLALGIATPIFGIWDKHNGTFFRASVMSIAYFGVSLCLLMAEGFLVYDFIYFSFEAFICFVSVYLIDGSEPVIQNYKSLSNLTERELASIVTLTAIGILACWSVPPLFGLNLASLLGIFIILAVNLDGNCILGAALGVVMGLVISMGSYESSSVVGAYAFASFMSGLFKKYSRLGVLLGFTLANAIITAFLNDTADMLINPIEVLVAGAIFVTLPKKTMHIFTDFARKANNISSPKHISKDNPRYSYTSPKDCSKLAASLHGLSDIYFQNTHKKRPGKRYIKNLFNKCADNVCSGCGLRFGCWQSVGHNNYDYMLEMMNIANSKGHLTVSRLPKKFADRCIKKDEFVRIFNLTYDIYKADKLWLDKTQLLHKLMATQLDATADAVAGLQSPDKDETEKLYSIHTTALQMSKEGEHICGDCFKEIYDRNGNYTAIISDGMGSGREANTQAKTTVDMMSYLADIEADADCAVELINSSLLLRSYKDCFSTLDILVSDMSNGSVNISKTGAAPTYIKTANGTTKFECNTLPVGILPEIQSQNCKFTIDKEGLIVMMSDGISNTVLKSQQATDWICGYLENTDSTNTEALANNILNTAIDKCGGECNDDMTIIVAYIYKNE
jgi:stage II sporulation protein E